MKNIPCKMLFSNNPKKRNMWLFDVGLHTLHMKMKPGEKDMEFVQRFLISYFDGCRERGGKQSKHYMMDHYPGSNYIRVWGIK
jgi:hypothetical protein